MPCAMAALLLFISAIPAQADDPSTLADRLAQVQQEQARQQQQLAALQGQQSQVRQALEAIAVGQPAGAVDLLARLQRLPTLQER